MPLLINDREIFTEPLPSNDKKGYTDTHLHIHRQQHDFISLHYFFKIRKVG
jgi:hypothetical protein